MKTIVIYLIKFYKKAISPFLPNSCRFYPTCSDYSMQAIREFGLLKGGFMSIKRIGRCHPFNPGGYDPVPGKNAKIKIKGDANALDLSNYYELL